MHLPPHFAWRTLLACVFAAGAFSARGQDGFLIRLTPQARLEVVPYRLPASGQDDQSGIAVWSRGGPEQWAILPGKLAAEGNSPELAATLRLATRGGSGSATAAGGDVQTFQPEQLLGAVVTRAVGLQFITPADQGVCLDGRITFRRQPDAGATKFPAAEVKLRRGNKELMSIPFTAGQAELSWQEIPGLPAALKMGLAAGEYSLRIGNGPLTSFRVADDQTRQSLLPPLERLSATAGNSPAYLLALVQHLSAQPDEDGEVRSYAADALDRLDAAARQMPALRKEAWFAQLRERVWKKLTIVDEKSPADVAATGIEDIDLARAAIQEGNWRAAEKTLALPAATATPRGKALVDLYRAVIAAESGSGEPEFADELYRAAIAQLPGGTPADLFRAHNNFGGMLQARARDQLHNHAFQAATGSPAPMLRTLDAWCGALANYEQALVQAEQLDPTLAAGVRVNLAGLYSLLADLILVLDVPVADQRRFVAGEVAARKMASDYAEQALAKGNKLDAVARAAAQEALAQLAHRGGKATVARQHAQQALLEWTQAESLPGVESIERLLGLIETKDAAAALRHLQTSQQLTELLRARIPTDRTGRSRAGFFARRAYVYERIIELLIAQGNARAALNMAETAKARSLQEVLAQRDLTGKGEPGGRSLDQVMADWPAGTAAIEYFLGTERAWVFVVNPRGEVQALQLTDKSGRAVASRDLIRRVQALLVEFEGQANKMFRRASAGNGFDHAWQDELHRFCGELLPEKVRAELKTAEQVVIVPHHVLHYFPFAALVTELDATPRGKLELPQPKFLVDEPFAISRAPSLTTWDLLRRKASTFQQVQAVGIVEFDQAEPLPGVEQDLANLRQVFGARLKKITAGEAATEQSIQAALREPGLLFVGTHGMNVADRPLASHLLCTAGDQEDGRLTAGELFSSEVNSSLIVLSACYSGLADRSPLPGDDLFGLERSFLNSGATTVVSGLWDVYDGTGPLLMKSFFEELEAGQPAAAALAGAQRKFLAERRREGAGDPWMHPYFWSVYTLSGSELVALERPPAR